MIVTFQIYPYPSDEPILSQVIHIRVNTSCFPVHLFFMSLQDTDLPFELLLLTTNAFDAIKELATKINNNRK